MTTRMNRHPAYLVGALAYLVFGAFASATDITGGANGVSLSTVSAGSQSTGSQSTGSQSTGSQSIRVTGPNGYAAVTTNSYLSSGTESGLADGIYKYEVTEKHCGAVSDAKIRYTPRDNAANGRAVDAQPGNCRDVIVDSGAFRIVNGVVPSKTLVEE